MKNIAILFLMINSLILSSQVKGNESFFPDLQSEIGKHFPVEDLKNDKGQSFEEDHFKEQVTFINFWFTTCAPCLEEMPLLNKLKEEIGSKVNFVGVTFDTKERVEYFLLKKDFNFSHITDMNADMQSLIKRYPMSFLLDKQGNIKRIIGKVSSENYELIKQHILDEK